MKKYFSSYIAILAVAFSLMISGCSQDNGVGSTNSTIFDNQDYLIAQVQPVSETITDMTMTQEMDITDPTIATCNPQDNRLSPAQRQMMGRDIWTLGRILKQLSLTSDQVTQIRSFMQAHKDCIDGIYLNLRQSERTILDDANQQWHAILQNLKDSVITPETARQQIRDLAQATRKNLLQNPVRTGSIAAIKDCRDSLLANIESILTADQLLTWNRLLAKIK